MCLDLELGPELWDASPRPTLMGTPDYGEDYGRWEGSHPFPAQRWLARVIDDTTGEPLWGFAPLDEDGCTGPTADISYEDEDPTTFTLQYVKWAHWPGGDRSIIAYGCTGMDEDPSCEFEVPRQVFSVEAVPSGTTYATVNSLALLPEEYPLWSTSFCEDRLPLRENFEIYSLYDPDGEIQNGTGVSLLFSGQPTVVFKGNGWHSKFRACHEYGHFQTFLLAGVMSGDLDYNYVPDPMNPPPSNQHTWNSAEWQSAACVEGFSHFYAVASWNDIDVGTSTPYLEGGSIEENIIVRSIPRSGGCVTEDGADEDPGVANEWNWVSALRSFRLDAEDTPELDLLIGMVGEAYNGQMWAASGAHGDFWVNFLTEMDGYLVDAQQVSDWETAAAEWCIDH